MTGQTTLDCIAKPESVASGEGGAGVGGDGHWVAGELDEHDGASFGGAFEGDGAAVVLHDFRDDGEAKASAVWLAGAYEGIENGRADR